MTPFSYHEPSTLEETAALLAAHGDDAKVVAGGTELINLMKQGLVQPKALVGLRSLTELTRIETSDAGCRIGALTTLHTLETSDTIKRVLPLLAETCRCVATVRIRVMATLGGAVAHADPHLDTPPCLIALDAVFNAVSQRGRREIPADQFFTGYYETVLAADELVADISVPPQPKGNGTSFIKFLPATHDDYATVSVAARVVLGADGRVADVRVALGSVGWTPIRARAVETAVRGMRFNHNDLREAASLVKREIDPIESFRASADYKRNMAEIHVHRALHEAISRARMATA